MRPSGPGQREEHEIRRRMARGAADLLLAEKRRVVELLVEAPCVVGMAIEEEGCVALTSHLDVCGPEEERGCARGTRGLGPWQGDGRVEDDSTRSAGADSFNDGTEGASEGRETLLALNLVDTGVWRHQEG